MAQANGTTDNGNGNVETRKKARWTQDGNELTVELPDGMKAGFNIEDIQDDGIKSALMGYGLKQKLADSIAVSKDMALTSDEKVKAMTDTFDQLVAGTWAQRGGGRKKDFTWAAAKTWNKDELSALHKMREHGGDFKKAWEAIPADVRKKFGYKD